MSAATDMTVTFENSTNKISVSDNKVKTYMLTSTPMFTDIVGENFSPSSPRQKDHEVKNRVDTAKDGEKFKPQVKEIIRRLCLYNLSKASLDDTNFVDPTKKGEILSVYLADNEEVRNMITVLNMCRDSNRQWIDNHNTTQNYTHVSVDSGLSWKAFIDPTKGVNKVGSTLR